MDDVNALKLSPSPKSIKVEDRITVQRTLTRKTEVHKFRIRRGKTTVIRRCQEVMLHLWQTGHKGYKDITKETLENAVFYCVGGDYRTIRKYVGFDIVTKAGHRVHIIGYLEKLHYVQRSGNGNYTPCHTAVPLDYHFEQKTLETQPPSVLPPNAFDE